MERMGRQPAKTDFSASKIASKTITRHVNTFLTQPTSTGRCVSNNQRRNSSTKCWRCLLSDSVKGYTPKTRAPTTRYIVTKSKLTRGNGAGLRWFHRKVTPIRNSQRTKRKKAAGRVFSQFRPIKGKPVNQRRTSTLKTGLCGLGNDIPQSLSTTRSSLTNPVVIDWATE